MSEGKLRYVGANQFAYGDLFEDGEPIRTTIHGTDRVNVEVDPNGRVVSIWFRCMLVPFDITHVNAMRTQEMGRAYAEGNILPVDAIIFHERP